MTTHAIMPIAHGWNIVRPGLFKDMNIYTQSENINPLMVIDVGSNSVKIVVYDCSVSPPRILDEDDELCGLAEGMDAHDKNPRLSETGIERVFTKAVPKILRLKHKHNPKGFNVFFTEAVRAAFNNKSLLEKKRTIEFIADFAEKIGVPVISTDDIASKKLESILGVGTTICAGYDNCINATLGGGSFEIGRNRNRQVVEDQCVTLRFGTRSLTKNPNRSAIIKKDIGSVSFLYADGTPICATGGGLRFTGRAAGEKLLKIPFDANPLEYKFIYNSEFCTTLRSQAAAPEILFATSFGAKSTEELKRVKIKKTTYVEYKDARGLKHLVQEDDFCKILRRWHRRIGRRAETISVGTEALLEVCRRVQPNHVIFINSHSMRDAVLWRTGLAYK